MTPEYKAEKEASVSHLSGGGIWEINHVTLVAPAAYFLWSVLQAKQGFFNKYSLPVAISDFLLQCCAILFAITVYGSSPQILNGLLFLPALATFLQPTAVPSTQDAAASSAKTASKSKADNESGNSTSTEKDPLPVKPFITAYRGAMMIITCASILAVDFPVFPRRFAKTESFGTSLMDLGVGSFVFAAGIVAARQQLKNQQKTMPSLVSRIGAALRHSFPLFTLGFARLLSVKNLDYVEHVSEYGVHWNFFFTLALLPPFVAILQPLLRVVPSLGLFAFAMACIYEMILYFTPGLKVYIILSERIPGDWLSQNREGVFSFIGYLAIFIGGTGLGMLILPRDPGTTTPSETAGTSVSSSVGKSPTPAAEKDVLDEDAEWLASVLGQPKESAAPSMDMSQLRPSQLIGSLPETTLGYLVKWTALWFIFALWAMWRYGPRLFVSRRMANGAYIIWVCAFNSAQLLLFYLVESFAFPNLYTARDRKTERSRIENATSKVLKSFNRNGLAIFLLANLLTGLINMSVPTLHMNDWQSMAILISYLAVLCGFGLFLDHADLSLKL